MIGERKGLWENKRLIAKDFNDIVSNEEKWGGKAREEWFFNQFRNFISDNQLVDVGFEGYLQTWCNNWGNEGDARQRLDRALSGHSRSQTFDRTKCRHVENFSLDHSMLMIDTNPNTHRKKKKFYFDKKVDTKKGDSAGDKG